MVASSDPRSVRVAAALSPDRFDPYLRATGGSHARALRLYEWNVRVSGAMFELLGVVEVVVRNAMGARLTSLHGDLAGCWYDDPRGILNGHAHRDIAQARSRLQKMRYEETPGRVVAELSFGFWTFLLAKRYEATLWTPQLRHAFPDLTPQRRATAYQSMNVLHGLRNRIAHHEPIHRRDLVADSQTIRQVLGWIDHEVDRWAADISRLPAIIAERPADR